MCQILRSRKFELYLLSRCYGTQSKYRTHYDTLQIPQTSSQKEIREAFIKISKEMHPDIKGKDSHSEFVKINEAYKILSKEHLRRQYDMDIKHGYSPENSSYSPYSSYPSKPYSYEIRRSPSSNIYYRQSPEFINRDEWEEYVHSQADNNYYGIKGIKRVKTMWIVFVCITVATISFLMQIIVMNKALAENKELLFLKRLQYQREYKKMNDAAKSKTKDEQLRDFESNVLMKNPKSVH